jgi:hypothetical protein
MLVAVRLVLLWVVCWLVLVLESREMLPLKTRSQGASLGIGSSGVNSVGFNQSKADENSKTVLLTSMTAVVLRLMLVAVRLVLLWVVCWLVLVLESREMLPLRLLELVPYSV